MINMTIHQLTYFKHLTKNIAIDCSFERGKNECTLWFIADIHVKS